MSNTGGDEADITGGSRMGLMNRASRTLVGLSARLGNVAAQTSEFKDLTRAINSVTDSLKNLSEQSGRYATTIANNLNKVTGAAPGAATTSTAAGNSNGNYQAQRNQASAAVSNTSSNTGTGSGSGSGWGSGASAVGGAAWSAASWLGGSPDNSLLPNLAMTPLRFMRDRIQNNRNVVLSASNMLNMTGLRAGVGQDAMLAGLGSQIGNVKGSPADIINMFANTGQLGASYGFGNAEGTGRRAGGFFQGVQQAQALNPGASVASIVGAIGGQAANTGAQQQSIMMTGGAFSMIGGGGRQKSLSEWADSILKWLQDLRPADQRGKPFGYGELMAQYYPGSNIDAWLNANGISPDMKEYWWTYVLGKANKSVGQDANGNLFQTAPGGAQGGASRKNNLAQLKLESTNVLTQGEFALGSKMSGAYGNKEQSNRMFNEMIQKFLVSALPSAVSDGVLGFMQYMPDIIEDLLFGLLERAPGNFQTAVGGLAIADMFIGGEGGDVGDMDGAYGDMGGTTTSGMHPDMRRKLGAMQKANPRVKITSGLRDTGLQQRLRSKGHKNVSGKASAHTRGMAADLGPASEYGWISRNAKKFGLHSGKSHGEPWHVGMVGDVDIGEGAWDSFMSTFSSLFTGTGSGGAEAMFDVMGSIMGLLGGALDSKAPGQQGSTSFDPDLYNKLAKRDAEGVPFKKFKPGPGSGVTTGGLVYDPATQTWVPGPTTGGGGNSTGSGTVGVGKNYLTGPQVAQLAYNQGFRGDNLVKAVAIAKRESGFDANAYNGNANTGDKSYGLWQVNMINTLGPSRRAALNISSNEELWQPEVSARAMKLLFDSNKTPFYHWGPYKDMPATYNTNVPEARTYVEQAGLGDMPEYFSPTMSPKSAGSITFVNTFNVSGGGGGGAGGGMDARRTVTQIADHLENEMKQRLARVS